MSTSITYRTLSVNEGVHLPGNGWRMRPTGALSSSPLIRCPAVVLARREGRDKVGIYAHYASKDCRQRPQVLPRFAPDMPPSRAIAAQYPAGQRIRIAKILTDRAIGTPLVPVAFAIARRAICMIS